MKTCARCKTSKEPNNYCANKNNKDGLHYYCRDCTHAYYEANKVHTKAYNKERRQKNKEIDKVRQKVYMAAHKIEKEAYDKTYRQQNVERIRQHKRNWKERVKDDPEHKIKRNLRRRVHHVIEGRYKVAGSEELLGCTAAQFKAYLESLWKPGMSWDNYGNGGWHMDHIIPCSAFDLTDPEQQKRCFHYTNHQPLWQADNLKKSYIYQGINCRINGPLKELASDGTIHPSPDLLKGGLGQEPPVTEDLL